MVLNVLKERKLSFLGRDMMKAPMPVMVQGQTLSDLNVKLKQKSIPTKKQNGAMKDIRYQVLKKSLLVICVNTL